MRPMSLRAIILDRFSLSSGSSDPGNDRVVVGANAIAVLDGSTERTDDGVAHGGVLADEVADCVMRLGPSTTVNEFLRLATERVAQKKAAAGVELPAGACVTIAVIHLGRSEIWRIGDPHLLVDGMPHPRPPITSPEAVLAQA